MALSPSPPDKIVVQRWHLNNGLFKHSFLIAKLLKLRYFAFTVIFYIYILTSHVLARFYVVIQKRYLLRLEKDIKLNKKIQKFFNIKKPLKFLKTFQQFYT